MIPQGVHMSTAPVQDQFAQFSDEVLQGHREAFAALRQVLSVAVNALIAKPPAEAPSGPLAPSDPRPCDAASLPPAQARTLNLALRAAMAILRKKPPEPVDQQDARPHMNPPRPLTRKDLLNIADSQRGHNGNKDLPFEGFPRLKAWQQYADHMGFPAPFEFPRDLLATFPGRPERAPESEQTRETTPART
jgi:hypothetical protein